MASQEFIETNVKTVYEALQKKFDGTKRIVHFLQDHLRSAYNDFTSKRFGSEQHLIETATYVILFCSLYEFQQHIQQVVKHYGLIYYIAFLLSTNNRKYIRSIVFHDSYRAIRLDEKNAMLIALIKQQLQVDMSQNTAIHFCKCLSLLGETELTRTICTNRRIMNIERSWLENNTTDELLIFVPPGNHQSLKYRISTLISLSSCSVDPIKLAQLGIMYDSHKNAYCFSCRNIVSEEELKNNGISAVRHTEDCDFMRQLNGNQGCLVA